MGTHYSVVLMLLVMKVKLWPIFALSGNLTDKLYLSRCQSSVGTQYSGVLIYLMKARLQTISAVSGNLKINYFVQNSILIGFPTL